jgi:arylsulfatase A-like enzyme
MQLSRLIAALGLCALSATGLGCFAESPSLSDSKLPNIVVITLDTVRADHVSVYGYPRKTTPALDRFAARGAVFDFSYSQAPSTIPTHASLFTGRYPYQHEMFGYPQVLAASELTLAEFFTENGYRSFAIASSVRFDESSGFNQGFESYRSLQDLEKNRRSEALVDLAIQAAQEIGDEPIFAFLHFFDAHSPYAPPDPYRSQWHEGSAPVVPEESSELLDKHHKKILPLAEDLLEHLVDLYDGGLSFQDHWLESLIEQWERLPSDRPTLWVITSDHGEELMDHQRLLHGQSLFEEQVRVPFILVYPGRVDAGQRIAEPIQSVDLFRTLADLAGLPVPASVEGRSFAGRLVDGTKPLPFSDSIESLILIERIEWFGIVAELPEGRFKWDSRRNRKIFDIENDPDELVDVSKKYRKVYRKMATLPKKIGLPDMAAMKAKYKKDWARAKMERVALDKDSSNLSPADANSPMSDAEMVERLRALGYVDELEAPDATQSR